jgi:hypothetical protein
MGKDVRQFYITLIILFAAVFLLNNIPNPSGKFIEETSELGGEAEEFLPLEKIEDLEGEKYPSFQEETIMKERNSMSRDELIARELVSPEVFAEIQELKKRGPVEALALALGGPGTPEVAKLE